MESLGAGAAGADMLQEILRQKFTEQVQRQQLGLEQQRIGVEQQRNQELQQSRELQQQQAAENAKYLNEQRAAATANEQAAGEARTSKQREIDALKSDPTIPVAARNWMRGAQVGFNQLTTHDYEDPTAHQAHVQADADRRRQEAVSQHGAIRDYDVAHPLPTRIAGPKTVADDPSLPLGAQRYIAQIATKHGGNFASARDELTAYLTDPKTAADHPRLSPAKALDVLKRATGGAAHTDPFDQLIAQASSGLLGGGASPPAGSATRIVGASVAGTPAPDGLAEKAAAVLQQGGYAATPENVQKFLSNPANRQRLGGQ